MGGFFFIWILCIVERKSLINSSFLIRECDKAKKEGAAAYQLGNTSSRTITEIKQY